MGQQPTTVLPNLTITSGRQWYDGPLTGNHAGYYKCTRDGPTPPPNSTESRLSTNCPAGHHMVRCEAVTNKECPANYGSNLGDNVCCDQEGTIDHSNKICDVSAPKCIKYVKDNTWGKCAVTNKECVADFGSNSGDNVCCGQEGTINDDNKICDAYAPKCIGYRFGQNYGICANTI